MLEPYNGGMDLVDLDGRKRVGIDVRGSGTTVTLRVRVNTERSGGELSVDMFDPAEVHELSGALLAAVERMVAMRVATGAPV